MKSKVIKENYGYLKTTGKYVLGERSHIFVECICICGDIVTKRFSELNSGNTKSCGKRECKALSKAIPIKNGDKFNFLTLTGNEYMKGRYRYVETICICGAITWKRLSHIKNGTTISCGCKQKEITAKISTTHGCTIGKKFHPIYNTWSGIKQRCLNSKCDVYVNYGGRGIEMCKEWKENFNSFYIWSLLNGWEKGLSLDRIENNEGYYPNNCRWATALQQSKNKRNNVFILAFGENKCISDWVKDDRCSISVMGLRKRINKGWENELAIKAPSKSQRFIL